MTPISMPSANANASSRQRIQGQCVLMNYEGSFEVYSGTRRD